MWDQLPWSVHFPDRLSDWNQSAGSVCHETVPQALYFGTIFLLSVVLLHSPDGSFDSRWNSNLLHWIYNSTQNYNSELRWNFILLKYQCITRAVWPRKSVFWSTRFSNGTNSPSYTLLYRQNFGRVHSQGWMDRDTDMICGVYVKWKDI